MPVAGPDRPYSLFTRGASRSPARARLRARNARRVARSDRTEVFLVRPRGAGKWPCGEIRSTAFAVLFFRFARYAAIRQDIFIRRGEILFDFRLTRDRNVAWLAEQQSAFTIFI